MDGAIFLAARFVRCQTLWPLFSNTDASQTIGGETETYQRSEYGVRSIFAKPQVVVGWPSIIAVALNHDHQVRKIMKERLERRSDS